MNYCVFAALNSVLETARVCRHAQRAYFASRCEYDLVRARCMESELDNAIRAADYAILHGCALPEQIEFPF